MTGEVERRLLERERRLLNSNINRRISKSIIAIRKAEAELDWLSDLYEQAKNIQTKNIIDELRKQVSKIADELGAYK